MKAAIRFALEAVNHCLLAGACVLVPGGERKEWWQEWQAELWQVRREFAFTGEFSWASECDIADFCLGAYKDAICLRQLARRARPPLTIHCGTAWQCVLVLAALLCASYALSAFLPGVRAELSMAQRTVRSGVLLIEDANNEDSPRTISSLQYRAWKARKQKFFDDFAFYRVTKEKVNLKPTPDGAYPSSGWGVARATPNLFVLMGLPISFAAADVNMTGENPGVILSESVWKREFGANPHVAGSIVQVGSRQATVIGVAPDGPWKLPGKVDAWVLEPDSVAGSGGVGYVVAHLTKSGKSMMRSTQVRIVSYAPHRSPDDMLGISIAREMPAPWQVFLFAAALAILALPALTSISPSEYSLSVNEIPWSRRLYRLGFLGAKIALLLPLVYYAAVDIGYGFTGLNPIPARYVQFAASFVGCLSSLSWALSDQKKRCPVCLRRVQHPARVGQFSRTFLAWSGTELVCMDGHSLLHVPALPTSWFSTQRWMFLDPSWKFLFADPIRE